VFDIPECSIFPSVRYSRVFDIPERALPVTEHRATIYRCGHCRGVTKAAFPEGMTSPAQYGERFKTAAIHLNVQQRIPEDRVAQTLSELFGAPPICPASVGAFVGKKARELGPSTRPSASAWRR